MPAKKSKSTKKPAKSAAPVATVVASPPAPAPSPAPATLTPGTVLKKLDRTGAVRCECTVEADGFRFEGKLYSSISAAAVAAAKSLGLAGTSFNGYVFWGLAKPSGRDLAHRLDGLWQRYASAATALLKADGADKAANVDRVRQHLAQLKELV